MQLLKNYASIRAAKKQPSHQVAAAPHSNPSKASDSREHKPRKPSQAFVSLAPAYSPSFLYENSAQRPA